MTNPEDLEYEIEGLKIAIDVLEHQLKNRIEKHRYHYLKTHAEVYGRCLCSFKGEEAIINPKCPRHGKELKNNK